MPQTCQRDFSPIIHWDLKAGKTFSLIEKRISINEKAHCFNKSQNSKHPFESSANKDPDNKETSEDEKKEKGLEDPRKKARWQGKKDKGKKE